VRRNASVVTRSMTIRLRQTLGIALITGLVGCATLQQIASLRHVSFALAGVREGRLAGVRLERIASYRDLSATELGRIALAVAGNRVPLSFTVNVRAENPADNAATATMVRLAWTLLLDDKETITGVLDTSYALPPGQPVTIPLQMSLNLSEFFDGPTESLIDLAAGLAGVRADPTRITLRAVPSIDTPLGRMSYPSPITIVSQTVGAAPPP
jgi:hypothetical protein